MPRVLSINGTLLFPPARKTISAAAGLIRRGGLVAFPTETVYGLGADATAERAVARIFEAKGRPPDKPLIVHVADLKQVQQVADSLPESALELMRRFWPGPLSLVLPRSAELPPEVSAGLPTVAVRMPAHPVALSLIRTAGVPLAAPSANRSGRLSPTEARHVLEELAGRIEAVLDGGPCTVGVESTVLDLSGTRPVILRPGAITREQLEETLGMVLYEDDSSDAKFSAAPGGAQRGRLRTPLILVTGSRERRRALIGALAAGCRRKGFRVGFLPASAGPGGGRQMAEGLFSSLRRLDRGGFDLILAEGFPPRGLGKTVLNRLRQAAVRVIKA